MSFAVYIKSLRKRRGLTLEKLRDLSGVSQTYITHVENGRRGEPSPDILRKLSVGLGIPYIHLMIRAGHLTEEDLQEYRSNPGDPIKVTRIEAARDEIVELVRKANEILASVNKMLEGGETDA